MVSPLHSCDLHSGRTPRGVRELKSVVGAGIVFVFCRTPRGVRELKSLYTAKANQPIRSHSAWGA